MAFFGEGNIPTRFIEQSLERLNDIQATVEDAVMRVDADNRPFHRQHNMSPAVIAELDLAFERCQLLGVPMSEQFVHEMFRGLTNCISKCSAVVPLLASCVRTYHALKSAREIRYNHECKNIYPSDKGYPEWEAKLSNLNSRVDEAEKVWDAAEEEIGDLVEEKSRILAEIFLFLETEKKAMVDQGYDEKACKVVYIPPTYETAEVFFGFKPFLDLFSLLEK